MTDVVYYLDHFANPDADLPRNQCECSSYEEVKQWHEETRDRLSREPTLKPPTVGQDIDKTLQIYRDYLYPPMRAGGIHHIVEDNASPHNSQRIRDSHREQGIHIVGYEATQAEKDEIVRLITVQTRNYRREQDRRAQITKQTRELTRLPAWPPNSPDLNLIEIVWSWMVRKLCRRAGGWPRTPGDLRTVLGEVWDDISLESFRELVLGYRARLMCVLSVQGNRHPQFA